MYVDCFSRAAFRHYSLVLAISNVQPKEDIG